MTANATAVPAIAPFCRPIHCLAASAASFALATEACHFAFSRGMKIGSRFLNGFGPVSVSGSAVFRFHRSAACAAIVGEKRRGRLVRRCRSFPLKSLIFVDNLKQRNRAFPFGHP